MTASFNVAPTQFSPVVRRTGNDHSISNLRWGLVPSWAPDEKIGASLVNGRAETVFERPAFRDAVAKRRCLVPVSGFYEWRPLSPKEKQPYYFRLPTGAPFFIAGLWDRWGPTNIETFTLLTRAADAAVEPVHHRMPVILEPADVDIWMNPDATTEQVRDTLKPRASKLESFPVSPRVNSPRNDSPDLLSPMQPESLF